MVEREFDLIEKKYNRLIELKTVFARRALARIHYLLQEGAGVEDSTLALIGLLNHGAVSYTHLEAPGNPIRVGFSEDCFVNGEDSEFILSDGGKLPLAHNLFDQDAIVLTDMAKAVTLCSEKGTRSVRVSYPQMNFLGIWHMPFTDAPYVCIEPWSALPSRKGRIEDLSEQPNLVHLPAGKRYENTWSIEIF